MQFVSQEMLEMSDIVSLRRFARWLKVAIPREDRGLERRELVRRILRALQKDAQLAQSAQP